VNSQIKYSALGNLGGGLAVTRDPLGGMVRSLDRSRRMTIHRWRDGWKGEVCWVERGHGNVTGAALVLRRPDDHYVCHLSYRLSSSGLPDPKFVVAPKYGPDFDELARFNAILLGLRAPNGNRIDSPHTEIPATGNATEQHQVRFFPRAELEAAADELWTRLEDRRKGRPADTLDLLGVVQFRFPGTDMVWIDRAVLSMDVDLPSDLAPADRREGLLRWLRERFDIRPEDEREAWMQVNVKRGTIPKFLRDELDLCEALGTPIGLWRHPRESLELYEGAGRVESPGS